ncbi:GNAT family N-acetyltransferase [Paenibacillus athensensis]|uniref:GNAT family acetyltransferase n=1 Tax=Paenibacillus athensensis TaxID=1967502 RepID=A0A4Y8Q8X3_9BACL|nr:GNAT family N-acetyltransferase [Paenibacillus athensensis]MCD1260043.1 GNAT family N-acetyltransferase [Paenibacillus athensensis]
MEYIRINRLEDPLFRSMHQLMQRVFPAEEVLEFELWREPLEDPGIRVFVAVHNGEVVGATEYRYYADWRVAMTDFTIIGRPGLGIGRFLARRRQDDLQALAAEAGQPMLGMFAEIYDPYQTSGSVHDFGGVQPMNPFVRREVLSHLGYKRLDLAYVHPSWENNGEPVFGLDLCFLPADETLAELPAALALQFLRRYYAVLPNKPAAWLQMTEKLERASTVALLPL